MTKPSPRTATARPPRRDSAPITTGSPGPDLGGRRAPHRRPIPFVAHQLLEYLLAGTLAELSVHIGRSGLLLAAAGAFALLALTARGPLGIARLCGPKVHGTLDIAVAVAVAAAPLVPTLRPDLNGIIVVEVAALAWVRLATLTRYAPPARRSGTSSAAALTNRLAPDATDPAMTDPRLRNPAPSPRPDTSVVTPPPRAVTPPGAAAPPPGAAAPPVAMVARGLGILAARSARRLPAADEKLRSGARTAGRHAARLRAWRKPPS